MLTDSLRALIPVAASLMLGMTACRQVPAEVIPPDRMAELMADVHIGEAVVEDNSRVYSSDSMKMLMKQSVYRRHGVTDEQVDTSMVWYGHHIDKYMEVYDKTISILEDRIAEAEKSGARTKLAVTTSADGDSVNIWQGLRTQRFTTDMASDIIRFHHTTDRNWERGDRFTLNAKMADTRSPMTMDIAVEYNDGTTEYSSASFSGDGMHSLEIVLDSVKSGINIYGSLRYSPAPGEVAFLDSISLVRTRNRDNNKAMRARHPSTLIRHR